MNLLLLLSALLSAMTGVSTGTRVPQPAAAVVQQVRALAGQTVRARVAQRPATALPSLGRMSASDVAPAPAPPARAPFYLTRLRE